MGHTVRRVCLSLYYTQLAGQKLRGGRPTTDDRRRETRIHKNLCALCAFVVQPSSVVRRQKRDREKGSRPNCGSSPSRRAANRSPISGANLKPWPEKPAPTTTFLGPGK